MHSAQNEKQTGDRKGRLINWWRGRELIHGRSTKPRERIQFFFPEEGKVMWECEKKPERRENGEARYEEGG